MESPKDFGHVFIDNRCTTGLAFMQAIGFTDPFTLPPPPPTPPLIFVLFFVLILYFLVQLLRTVLVVSVFSHKGGKPT